ncbi:MAG: hypothetical protein HY342_01510 [Candidatus Lambdaproteobacteria bacterium]|nr:hypothetical protein [Candidatus Lambdaproteobacteria bacterium]
MKDFDIRKVLPGAAPQPTKKIGDKAPAGQADFSKALETAVNGMNEIRTQADTFNAQDVSATRAIAEKILEHGKNLSLLYQRWNAKESE